MILAEKLKEFFEFVDSSVFPEKPLPVEIIPEYPGRRPQFALAHIKDAPENDFYLIFSEGLATYFLDGMIYYTHAMMEPSDRSGNLYSQEEMLIGAAIHEVRHRLYYHENVPLFDKTHLDRVPRCRYFAQVQSDFYRSWPDGSHEFDAKFFECFGAYEFRRKRLQSPEQVNTLLRMTPQEFISRYGA